MQHASTRRTPGGVAARPYSCKPASAWLFSFVPIKDQVALLMRKLRCSWLIAIAFWLAGAFIKSGLGNRIAYNIVKLFGKTTLGLTYSLVIAEGLLAPAIPSVAARAGGIFFPLAKALCLACGSDPENGTEKVMGAYLMKVRIRVASQLSARHPTDRYVLSFCGNSSTSPQFYARQAVVARDAHCEAQAQLAHAARSLFIDQTETCTLCTLSHMHIASGASRARHTRAASPQVCFQATTISSAMFITAMAANPLAVNLAADAIGQTISWGTWALAGIVPGLFAMLTMPLLMYIIYPPEKKDTPDAPKVAQQQLEKLGPMSTDEKITAGATRHRSGCSQCTQLHASGRCNHELPPCAICNSRPSAVLDKPCLIIDGEAADT